MQERINLKSLSKDDIDRLFKDLGLPAYRTKQLLHWIYKKYAFGIQDITEFSADLRRTLGEAAFISNLTVVRRLQSADGAEKFLFGLEDGLTIESVLIPDKDRLTVCISSQVGCAMGCKFCVTGGMGLTRNLRAHEIVDQIIAINRSLSPSKKITNVVLMGMGEPLANLDEVISALWTITDLIGISKRKITLSTSGLAPKLPLLAKGAPEINLAISLNAATDASRNEIMPVNRTYPLKTLLEACRRYPLSPQRRITFEYVLINGINDSGADAHRLVGLLSNIRCKINLIPLNPHQGSLFRRPTEEKVLHFQDILIRNKLTALIRESRGQDIMAACGQLKAEH